MSFYFPTILFLITWTIEKAKVCVVCVFPSHCFALRVKNDNLCARFKPPTKSVSPTTVGSVKEQAILPSHSRCTQTGNQQVGRLCIHKWMDHSAMVIWKTHELHLLNIIQLGYVLSIHFIHIEDISKT